MFSKQNNDISKCENWIDSAKSVKVNANIGNIKLIVLKVLR